MWLPSFPAHWGTGRPGCLGSSGHSTQSFEHGGRLSQRQPTKGGREGEGGEREGGGEEGGRGGGGRRVRRIVQLISPMKL